MSSKDTFIMFGRVCMVSLPATGPAEFAIFTKSAQRFESKAEESPLASCAKKPLRPLAQHLPMAILPQRIVKPLAWT